MQHARSLILSCTVVMACSDDGSALPTTEGTTSTNDTPSSSEGTTPIDSSGGSGGVESGDVSSSDTPTDPSSSADSSSSGPSDTPPHAFDDLYRTPMDAALVVAGPDGLFANDVDPETKWLGLVEADAVSERGGVVVVEDDGGFTYTPPEGVWGRDSFGYTALDSSGTTTSATATINVLPTQVSLAAIVPGVGGYVIDGEDNAMSGIALAGAGDVDGDGLGDMVFGAPDGNTARGEIDVVFGKADHDAVWLGDVANGEGGFRISGPQEFRFAGDSVDGAGDVDGDGLDDLVIANPGAVFTQGEIVPFAAHVVFGKVDGAPVDLAEVQSGTGGFTITGVMQASGYQTVLCVAGAGDVNGDGLADVLVSTSYVPDSAVPRAWVVFGKANAEPVVLETLAEDGHGFVIEGAAAPVFPMQSRIADGAGDVNGDGADDLLIGESGAGPNERGRVYVVFGKPDTDNVSLAEVAVGVGGFAIDGEEPYDHIGEAVSGAGDVDGDGLADVVIGAFFAGDAMQGRGYVVFGKADTDPVALADVVLGTGGFAITAPNSAALGESVAGGGDIDGDGLDDIVLSSSVPIDVDTNGRAFVVYGKSGGDAVDLAAWMDGSHGYRLDSETGFYDLGGSVAIPGDVDGDGLADVLLSAYGVPSFAGRVYMFAGTSTAPHATPRD